jgi:hypothetical protein
MTPLSEEWGHLLIVSAALFGISIMSDFFEAYLLIVLFMLIRLEMFIRSSAWMD